MTAPYMTLMGMTMRPSYHKTRVAIDALQVGTTPAGIGRYIIELAKALDSCACETDEITVYISQAAVRLFEWQPQRIHIVPVRGGGKTRSRILRQQLVLPRLMNRGCDVVHYPDYLTPLRRPAPCVITVHDVAYAVDPTFYTPSQRVWRHLMYPVALRATTAIIAVSDFTRREILRLFPKMPPDRVRVVHLGVQSLGEPQAEVCRRLRDRFGLPSRFVLSVCTREPRKNLDRLLHAFGRSPELADEHLVLVGGAGWGPDSLDVLSAYGPQLRRRVLVTGYVATSELAALYHMASAFIYISLYEGFGLPPLEALSCGLPAIVSDIPVLHEVLGSSALYVNPYDVDDIAAGVRAMLRDSDLRARLAAEGRERARRFTWARCASETLAIYREVASQRAGLGNTA